MRTIGRLEKGARSAFAVRQEQGCWGKVRNAWRASAILSTASITWSGTRPAVSHSFSSRHAFNGCSAYTSRGHGLALPITLSCEGVIYSADGSSLGAWPSVITRPANQRRGMLTMSIHSLPARHLEAAGLSSSFLAYPRSLAIHSCRLLHPAMEHSLETEILVRGYQGYKQEQRWHKVTHHRTDCNAPLKTPSTSSASVLPGFWTPSCQKHAT